jgi:CheY-like chemotaxis protein
LKKTAPAKFASADGKNLHEVRILLVEDNDINRLYARSILKQWKCEVDIAENGLVAIEKIKNNLYDVILMDIQMPVMDGYEATRAIRLMDSHMRNAPIVALTANATKADIEKCLLSGMNDYLPKPFTPDDLYRKIFKELKIKGQKNGVSVKPASDGKSKFDLTYLRTVSDNNHDFIQEMIQTFVQSVPPVLEEMHLALNNQSWEKLSRLAHQIKPSFSLLGMDALRKAIIFIEENARKKTKLEQLPEITASFISDCEKVIEDLSKEA